MKNSAKLIADSMLGDIVRKLRLYGLDVLYYSEGDDEGLLNNYKERILLTGDEELYLRAMAKGRNAILLRVGEDKARLVAEVLKALNLKPRLKATRCTVCNGRLKRASQGDLKGVPEGVKAAHKAFYVCESCGKIYWMGSHWRGIKEFNRKVKGIYSKL